MCCCAETTVDALLAKMLATLRVNVSAHSLLRRCDLVRPCWGKKKIHTISELVLHRCFNNISILGPEGFSHTLVSREFKAACFGFFFYQPSQHYTPPSSVNVFRPWTTIEKDDLHIKLSYRPLNSYWLPDISEIVAKRFHAMCLRDNQQQT